MSGKFLPMIEGLSCRSCTYANRFWLCSVSLFLLGCGGGDGTLAPVTGRVVYKSQPVVGADVQFLAPDSKRPSTGVTDSEGKFVLSTYDFKDGARIGPNVVMISKLKSDPGAAMTDAQAQFSDPKSMAKMADQQVQVVSDKLKDGKSKSNSLIPEKYGNPGTTTLKAEVEKGGRNEFVFELTD